MFNETNIIDFINKIINKSNEEEKELKNNLEKFKEYLLLTKMSNLRITEWINQVIYCLPEILSLKKKIKNIDIKTLININEIKTNEENKIRTLTKKINDKLNDKYYNNYGNTNTSTNSDRENNTRT